MASGTSSIEREYNELWRRSMDAIGVRIEFDVGKFADHVKEAKTCRLMMWSSGWTADYPDGENFMQLLYGHPHWGTAIWLALHPDTLRGNAIVYDHSS